MFALVLRQAGRDALAAGRRPSLVGCTGLQGFETLDRVLEVGLDEQTGRAIVEQRDGGKLSSETLAGLEV